LVLLREAAHLGAVDIEQRPQTALGRGFRLGRTSRATGVSGEAIVLFFLLIIVIISGSALSRMVLSNETGEHNLRFGVIVARDVILDQSNIMGYHDSLLARTLAALTLAQVDLTTGEDQLADEFTDEDFPRIDLRAKVVEAHKIEGVFEGLCQNLAEGLLPVRFSHWVWQS
jgi:hypothetical protein